MTGKSTNSWGSRNRTRASELRRAEDRTVLRFCVITILGIVAFFAVSRISVVGLHVVYPYTQFIAYCSRWVLRMTGHEVSGTGSMIVGPSFSVQILNICNGLEVTGIFLAAVLAFPTGWKNRLTGLAIGYPVIFAVNVARIATLYILGYRIPNVFESVHRYYAQALVIIVTLSVWVFWVTKFTDYGAKARRRVSA
jgi:exosortase H (IPTLxxWG-CTERM-specific)